MRVITDANLNLGLDEKFKIFLEAAPDAIVVVDKEGCMVMINQLTEAMFGYSRNELIGSKVEVLVPERLGKIHIVHREGYIAEPKTRRMGEGRELSGMRKNGSEFPIEISLSPLLTDHEKLVISTIRDITSRKKLEAKFQGLLESAPDGIVVIDTNGIIAIVNSETEKLFNYAKNELIGQAIEVLVPNHFKDGHVALRNGYIANPHTRPMGAGRSLTGRKKDGTEFPVEISLSPLETEQGMLITSIVRDITDRRKVEEQVKSSLREKEVLLKEIHHRVKNNLQVTSSLLRLQSDYIKDEHAKELFAESQNRIRSMALVHEKLYQSSDLSRIKLIDYVESLAQLLFRSYGVDSNIIKLDIKGDAIFLSIDTAVPCGLMINELLSNCLKHAFPSNRNGEILVRIEGKENGIVTLLVSDNGVGLPVGFNFEQVTSLGLQLVRTLAKQLNGQLEINNSEGVRIKFSFLEEALKNESQKNSDHSC